MQQTLFARESSPAFSTAQGIPIYRVTLVREGHAHYGTLRHSQHAEGIIQRYLEGTDREHFVVLLLDKKNKVIGINTVAIGSLSSTVVHPREVFKPAILANAAAIICAHNHPSGDPDRNNGRRLLLDHLQHIGDRLKEARSFQDVNQVREQLLAFSQVVGDRAFFGFYGDELTPIDAAPGSYRVTLHVDGRSHAGSITIRNDPLVDKN